MKFRVIGKTRILIILPVVFIVICAAAAFYIPFDRTVTDVEMQVLNFIPSSLKVVSTPVIVRALKGEGPFDFASAQPVTDHAAEHLGKEQGATVSLIVISGDSRMAVIDGMTVQEGDSIRGMRIAKIESDRILLQNRSSQWLYLKEE